LRIPGKIVGFVMFMVLRALNYAHEYAFDDGSKGIIHRDVSPGNILIDEGNGFVKLTDFGVATQKSEAKSKIEIAGKVPYMAPEVLTNGSVDARADLYSLGVVCYELLTGFNPNINTSHIANVISAITSVMLSFERPVRPPHEVVHGIDPNISVIVEKLLTTDPNDRYRTAEEVVADLTYCLYNSGVGPNSAGLASYIRLIKNPDVIPDTRDKNALPFLTTNDGILEVRKPWQLTKDAAAEIDSGRTPGRVWS
jgi:serine/threonine protein kinase